MAFVTRASGLTPVPLVVGCDRTVMTQHQYDYQQQREENLLQYYEMMLGASIPRDRRGGIDVDRYAPARLRAGDEMLPASDPLYRGYSAASATNLGAGYASRIAVGLFFDRWAGNDGPPKRRASSLWIPTPKDPTAKATTTAKTINLDTISDEQLIEVVRRFTDFLRAFAGVLLDRVVQEGLMDRFEAIWMDYGAYRTAGISYRNLAPVGGNKHNHYRTLYHSLIKRFHDDLYILDDQGKINSRRPISNVAAERRSYVERVNDFNFQSSRSRRFQHIDYFTPSLLERIIMCLRKFIQLNFPKDVWNKEYKHFFRASLYDATYGDAYTELVGDGS